MVEWTSYCWTFPLISGLAWLSTLLTLLLHWILHTHCGLLPSMLLKSTPRQQTIAYISDVAAFELKPVFVAGCVLTSLFLDLSLGADRWLRHRGLLPGPGLGDVRRFCTADDVLAVLALGFALVGTVGLCLCSGFDTYRYPRLHKVLLLLFIAGYLISGVLTCCEYQRLRSKHRSDRLLRLSFRVKLGFCVVELVLAGAFVCNHCVGAWNAAALVEWPVAVAFAFYIFSFAIDLYPARGRGGRRGRGWPKERSAVLAAKHWPYSCV